MSRNYRYTCAMAETSEHQLHAMSDSDDTLPPGNAEAKLLLLIFFVVVSPLLVVILFSRVLFDRSLETVIPAVYALPAVLALSLFLAIRLACRGTSRIPAALATIGVLYIVGGGMFDMIATVKHTPTLQDEGNMIVRVLFDSDHSVHFVYAYVMVAQALLLILISTLWVAFLRHREALITSVENERSLMPFLKAATGGAHLTWRQWIIPLKMSEMPRAFPLMWVMVVGLVAGASDRWYLGLEWYDLVSFSRWACVGMSVFVGLLAYFLWLWAASRGAEHAA